MSQGLLKSPKYSVFLGTLQSCLRFLGVTVIEDRLCQRRGWSLKWFWRNYVVVSKPMFVSLLIIKRWHTILLPNINSSGKRHCDPVSDSFEFETLSSSPYSLSLTQSRSSQVEQASLTAILTSNRDTWPVHHITKNMFKQHYSRSLFSPEAVLLLHVPHSPPHCYMSLPFIMLLCNLMIQGAATSVHLFPAVRLSTQASYGVQNSAVIPYFIEKVSSKCVFFGFLHGSCSHWFF